MGKTARGGKEEEKKKKSVRQHCFHDAPGADANRVTTMMKLFF
jgi:hypothetical protein